MNFRIGYGIRNIKTHQLIKFFPNLTFYKELQKFKSENPYLEKNTYQITNEIQNGDLRTFYFWGDNLETHYNIPENESLPNIRKPY